MLGRRSWGARSVYMAVSNAGSSALWMATVCGRRVPCVWRHHGHRMGGRYRTQRHTQGGIVGVDSCASMQVVGQIKGRARWGRGRMSRRVVHRRTGNVRRNSGSWDSFPSVEQFRLIVKRGRAGVQLDTRTAHVVFIDNMKPAQFIFSAGWA